MTVILQGVCMLTFKHQIENVWTITFLFVNFHIDFLFNCSNWILKCITNFVLGIAICAELKDCLLNHTISFSKVVYNMGSNGFFLLIELFKPFNFNFMVSISLSYWPTSHTIFLSNAHISVLNFPDCSIHTGVWDP